MDAPRQPVPVVIVAGGDPIERGEANDLPRPVHVIAADSGLDRAGDIGLEPDVVIGDMDSVDPDTLRAAQRAGARIHRHPAAKDATDLELALDHAHRHGHRTAIVIGGAGGRVSHVLGNAAVIASPAYAGMAIEWRLAGATVRVVRPDQPRRIDGAPGDLVSLLAVGGPTGGITTAGLRWRLADATLEPGSTRGISNEMEGAVAEVSLATGALLAIHERTR